MFHRASSRGPHLKIEVVTVCVGYGDFLAASLPENLPLVDNLIVVTSPDDHETRQVCRKHSVHHVLTEDHTRDGPFNKARLIQRGFDQIGGCDWILHLDADVVLPRKFRQLATWGHLDERTIYGADRCNLTGWNDWARLKQHVGAWDNHAHECGHWFHPTFPAGSRWVSSIHGYVPIGFFQLFHGSAMVQNGYHVRKYLLEHGDAARTDVQFALQWDRRHRQVLPEAIVLHLDSAASELGTTGRGGRLRGSDRQTRPPPHTGSRTITTSTGATITIAIGLAGRTRPDIRPAQPPDPDVLPWPRAWPRARRHRLRAGASLDLGRHARRRRSYLVPVESGSERAEESDDGTNGGGTSPSRSPNILGNDFICYCSSFVAVPSPACGR